ncbi:hypothetical protein EYF80_028528 [Liparis tanakae]|uniref:Uncharacterized protein n=1 Tax=Liparis tanakae TaxID=230148 RepID=A0A4Z2H883_9TELE|nr:hypothetical protein EYF80_028528 [Liparis tanakae]
MSAALYSTALYHCSSCNTAGKYKSCNLYKSCAAKTHESPTDSDCVHASLKNVRLSDCVCAPLFAADTHLAAGCLKSTGLKISPRALALSRFLELFWHTLEKCLSRQWRVSQYWGGRLGVLPMRRSSWAHSSGFTASVETDEGREEVIGASVLGPSGLTFGSVDHLSIYCSGDDGLGKILQVTAQTVAQDGEFHRIQVCSLASMGGLVSGRENCSVKSSRQKPAE